MLFSIMVYMYISIYNWITSLYSGNEHNIVNQQYFYKINFLKNKTHDLIFEVCMKSLFFKIPSKVKESWKEFAQKV